ncbi:MAG: ABC transporter substrate-binding protein, partial [Comamonas sp.]
SSAHYLLVRALDKAGIAWADIQPVYLAPADARAAFERKSVDAWAIWDPYYAATEISIRPRVLTNGEGLSGNNAFYLSSKGLVERHPQVIRALFDELTRADQLVQTTRKEVVQLVAAFSGLEANVVNRFIGRRPSSPTTLLSPAIVADQQRVADAFFRLGVIPRQVRVADIVWQPTAEQYAKYAQLNSSALSVAAKI